MNVCFIPDCCYLWSFFFLKFLVAGGNFTFFLVDHDKLKDDETVNGEAVFAPLPALVGPGGSSRGGFGELYEPLPCNWALN